MIAGVTGTLRSASDEQLQVLKEFNITRASFMPSVYVKEDNFKMEQPSIHTDVQKFRQAIASNAEKRRDRGQPVLVFFKDEKELLAFTDSEYGRKLNARVVVERTSAEEKRHLINLSTRSGTVTLFTRSFARGTDFKVFDKNSHEGVHVLLTFLGESISEDIQIKGRTARQGKDGTMSILLLVDDLLKQLYKDNPAMIITDESPFGCLDAQKNPQLYENILARRNAIYEEAVKDMKDKMMGLRTDHVASEKLMEMMALYCREGGKKLRRKCQEGLFNICERLAPKTTSETSTPLHIVVCIDESSSMTLTDEHGISRYVHVRRAFQAFAEDRAGKAAHNNDEVVIITYNLQAQDRTQSGPVPLTADMDAIIGKPSMGGTNFSKALELAYANFEKYLKNAGVASKELVLLFMTDGEDLYPSHSETAMNRIQRLLSKQGDYHLYVIGFGDEAQTPFLQRLAELGGGKYFPCSDGGQLVQQFEVISAEVSAPVMRSKSRP